MLLRLVPLMLFAAPALAEPPKREAFEVAVDNGLQYLAQSQNADGSWNSGRMFGGGPGGAGRDPAITGLCVMAFLSAGHVPGEGRYAAVVEKGIRYVAQSQQRNGLFAGNQFGQTAMYSHGICTLMVAEAIGLLPDRNEAGELRKKLELGVRLIKAAQSNRGNDDGGWRYNIQPHDADVSVTAWQIMALRAAKNVGCDVAPSIIERAVEYLKRTNDPSTGGFRYTLSSSTTIPCTGAAVLSLELCGKEFHDSPLSRRAGEFLRRRENWLSQHRPHFYYGIYYSSQAMFQLGGEYWKLYRQVLHSLLLHPTNYPPRAGGFWTAEQHDDANAGVNYCTSMAILALTVEYRFLPIYQRLEEEEK